MMPVVGGAAEAMRFMFDILERDRLADPARHLDPELEAALRQFADQTVAAEIRKLKRPAR